MNEQVRKILARLDERDTLQSLSPQQVWDRGLEEEIEALNMPTKQSNSSMIALLVGLHLRNDSIDSAHDYAQQVEHEALGAYWHGIIHRMEGDYSNSKYWFRRVGEHPVMNIIKQRTSAWLKAEADLDSMAHNPALDTLRKYRDGSGWDAASFVDLIVWQESLGDTTGSGITRHILEQIQHFEVSEIFDFTMQAASMA